MAPTLQDSTTHARGVTARVSCSTLLQATCTNTYGSFNCTCAAGYTGNCLVCGDADECNDGTSRCDSNAACTNRLEGYDCACKKGFRPVTDDCEFCHGGFRCDDIDELPA